jgi:hypothetical protein
MQLVTENLIRAHQQDLLRAARSRRPKTRQQTRRHRFRRSQPAG